MKDPIQTLKRIFAIFAIVVILLLYLTVLVLAIMNNKYTHQFFMGALFASFIIPFMLYVMFWIAGVFKDYSVNKSQKKDTKNNLQKNAHMK